MRLAAAFLAALASFVAGPNAALAAAPQHHDQVPGFYRMKVGDLEVTALFDGTGVFDPGWLNGTKATMNGVQQALHEDPHMLDVADTGFLVNTGKQRILVDAGAGGWWGGGAFGRLARSLRSAGYPPEDVNILKQCGASAIYTPKDFQLNDIMLGIVKLVDAKAEVLAGISVPVPPLRAREKVPVSGT